MPRRNTPPRRRKRSHPSAPDAVIQREINAQTPVETASTPSRACSGCGAELPRKWPHAAHAQCWKRSTGPTSQTTTKKEATQ